MLPRASDGPGGVLLLRAEQLPDLADFESPKSLADQVEQDMIRDQVKSQSRFSRGDREKFRTALELDPNADMDSALFEERE